MLMEKRLGGGWKGGSQTECILESVQIANQAAKLEGFVGECVRERAVKRKEVAATQAKVYMTSIPL